MNVDAETGWDLERELEGALRARLGRLQGPSPEIGQSAYQAFFLRLAGRRRLGLRSLLSRTLMLSLAAGWLVAASSSAAAMVTAGGTGPRVLGRVVSASAQECRGLLEVSQDGMEDCVIAVSRQLRAWQGEGSRGIGGAPPRVSSHIGALAATQTTQWLIHNCRASAAVEGPTA